MCHDSYVTSFAPLGRLNVVAAHRNLNLMSPSLLAAATGLPARLLLEALIPSCTVICLQACCCRRETSNYVVSRRFSSADFSALNAYADRLPDRLHPDDLRYLMKHLDKLPPSGQHTDGHDDATSAKQGTAGQGTGTATGQADSERAGPQLGRHHHRAPSAADSITTTGSGSYSTNEGADKSTTRARSTSSTGATAASSAKDSNTDDADGDKYDHLHNIIFEPLCPHGSGTHHQHRHHNHQNEHAHNQQYNGHSSSAHAHAYSRVRVELHGWEDEQQRTRGNRQGAQWAQHRSKWDTDDEEEDEEAWVGSRGHAGRAHQRQHQRQDQHQQRCEERQQHERRQGGWQEVRQAGHGSTRSESVGAGQEEKRRQSKSAAGGSDRRAAADSSSTSTSSNRHRGQQHQQQKQNGAQFTSRQRRQKSYDGASDSDVEEDEEVAGQERHRYHRHNNHHQQQNHQQRPKQRGQSGRRGVKWFAKRWPGAYVDYDVYEEFFDDQGPGADGGGERARSGGVSGRSKHYKSAFEEEREWFSQYWANAGGASTSNASTGGGANTADGASSTSNRFTAEWWQRFNARAGTGGTGFGGGSDSSGSTTGGSSSGSHTGTGAGGSQTGANNWYQQFGYQEQNHQRHHKHQNHQHYSEEIRVHMRVLGLDTVGVLDEAALKAAFRARAKQTHPDLHSSSDAAGKVAAEEAFKAVQQAYQALSKAVARA